ncbi:transcriptional regulator, GntR family [Oceanobacillus limi]|uniref:Transcriptional regulator, GntR family n=1 Tax=Oceanobacillus limi TaxID=930131 RepID=A0A1I0EZ69_9BACI|nr:GntR family transcriptional regulator [Oceanobacillus limi]SET50847.1 transcriptional regulator, GntR family [Oceanobacillus limi]
MELPIRLSQDSREPIYHQIEHQLKALIAGGNLRAGTSLPSIRSLSKDLEVSVITTRRAYQNLEAQGFIKTLQGKGTFVAEIEDSLKKQVKESTVRNTLERAVETALSYEYTASQVEELFQEIMNNHRKEKGD